VLAFIRLGSGARDAIAFLALFVVLVIRPQGLFGARIRERL
jgi:branched-subunit amino acid ABC-type transport system permease component